MYLVGIPLSMPVHRLQSYYIFLTCANKSLLNHHFLYYFIIAHMHRLRWTVV